MIMLHTLALALDKHKQPYRNVCPYVLVCVCVCVVRQPRFVGSLTKEAPSFVPAQ